VLYVPIRCVYSRPVISREVIDQAGINISYGRHSRLPSDTNRRGILPKALIGRGPSPLRQVMRYPCVSASN
jgi:hypothetical protein